jgi:probable O-glycosylation ligase (exosortase A-associated)
MKQMIFMLVTSFLGIAGAFTVSPVWGIAVYYGYAVLRPQFIWEWVDALGVMIRDVSWSYYVAVATMAATALWWVGLPVPLFRRKTPWYGRVCYTRSHYLFLAFTFWIGLTYFTAVNRERAEPWFWEYVKIFTMFVCATLVLQTVGDLWLIYHVVLACAVYIAYEINFFYLATGWLFLQARGYGGLDNNGAALIVGMAIPMAFFAWEGTRHWVRWGFLAVIPLLMHALMLSFSRGGMLALCVAAVFVWFRCRNKGFVSIVYAAAFVFVLATAGKEIQQRFFSISEHEADASAQSRLTTWKIAIKMANERPLFGFGIRCSNLFTHDYGADMPGRSIHSQYLQTAADSGWVALALYLAVIASMFLGLREVRKFLRGYSDPDTLRVRSLASGIECSLVLFCFGAIFLSLEHFEMPYVLLLLGLQLHAITRAVARWHPAAPPPTRGGSRPSSPSPLPSPSSSPSPLPSPSSSSSPYPPPPTSPATVAP